MLTKQGGLGAFRCDLLLVYVPNPWREDLVNSFPTAGRGLRHQLRFTRLLLAHPRCFDVSEGLY